MLGSTSARITRLRFSPSASAAMTKSRDTMPSATPRARRATRGAWETPTSTMRIHAVGCSIAVSTSSASRICGNDRTTSLKRMITSSHQPPPYAATTPIAIPSTMPSSVPNTAMIEDLLAAVHDPAEHVLAEVVGAEEPVLAEGRTGHLVLPVGREEGRDDHERHQQQRDRRGRR